MNRDDFRRLSEIRLEDAKVLLGARRFEAACYLAGYSVECALKACICASAREFEFPRRNGAEYYQHDLQRLSILAGVENEFEQAREIDRTLAANWNVVKQWSEDRRYNIGGPDLERAANNVIEAISDDQHGVLQWLSKYF